MSGLGLASGASRAFSIVGSGGRTDGIYTHMHAYTQHTPHPYTLTPRSHAGFAGHCYYRSRSVGWLVGVGCWFGVVVVVVVVVVVGTVRKRDI